MNYIDEIFTRLDIQHIRQFLMHGTEAQRIHYKSYKERLEETEKTALACIRSKYPDEDEYEVITDKVFDYASACGNVYMEIGMQCGVKLAMQFFSSDDRERQSYTP